MSIFDRWGALIFHTTDVNERWDATDGSGNLVREGAYIYRIYIQETYAEPFEFTGTVTVLR